MQQRRHSISTRSHPVAVIDATNPGANDALRDEQTTTTYNGISAATIESFHANATFGRFCVATPHRFHPRMGQAELFPLAAGERQI
jgi:hypothetical protein